MVIKQFLYKVLGVKNYLRVVSRLFFWGYDMRLLASNPTFDGHYFVRKLVKRGDHVIDIGANLGYYSRTLAHCVGQQGKLFSVEPVTLFREILSRNLRGLSQATILPYALGEMDDQPIRMGIPRNNKYLRHGLTHVLEKGEQDDLALLFEERMFTPQTVFKGLDRCDFIKCDVEGYEHHIVPLLAFILDPFHPIIQIELSHENREVLTRFLAAYSYEPFVLKGEKLYPVDNLMEGAEGDWYFIPQARRSVIQPYLA